MTGKNTQDNQGGKTPLVDKKPYGYWTNISNIEKEVTQIAKKLGHFPSCDEFDDIGQVMLRKNIYRYPGGKIGLMASLGFEPKKRIIPSIIEPAYDKSIYQNLKSKFKTGKIEGLNDENSQIIIRYLFDMELGLNTKSKRKVSEGRLIQLYGTLKRLAELIEKNYHKSLISLSNIELHQLFNDLIEGNIKKLDGESFKRVANLQRDYIAFYNWYMRVSRREGKKVINLIEDLSKHKEENTFCYFTLQQLKEVLPYFSKDEQALLLFCFDSIVRSPKELCNIRVSDLSIMESGEVWVNVRQEISKTYGRKFNLVLCGNEIKDYLARRQLNTDMPLFPDYALSTKYRAKFSIKLKKIFVENFGDINTLGGLPFSKITLYSFRHCGACWLRGLNIPLDKLLTRGGWRGIERLNYYTRFLGLNGEITREEIAGKDNKLMEIIKQQQAQIQELTQQIGRLTSLLLKKAI
jgi:integrase